MVIQELYLKNFGKFSNKKIMLKDGINLFYGENENGKTTIHTFIRGMLFNIEKQRGKSSKNDIYSLYEPWENPGYYAGVLRFESGGKIFRLDRNFQKSQKKSVLVCETDGEEMSIEHGDLNYILEGLNEINYRNTISIRQLKAETDSGLAVQLENFMANYQDTGDADVDVSAAETILQEQKKELDKKEKEIANEQLKAILSFRSQREHLEKNIYKKEWEKASNHEKRQALESEYKQLSGDIERLIRIGSNEGLATKSKSAGVAYFIIIIMSIIFFIALPAWYEKGVSILAGGIFLWLVHKFSININMKGSKRSVRSNSDKSNRENEVHMKEVSGQQSMRTSQQSNFRANKEAVLQKRQKAVNLEIQKLNWLIEKLEDEMLELNTEINNIEESLLEQKDGSEEQLYIREQKAAINRAYDTIVRLSGDIHKEKGNKLNELASKILSDITDGTYSQIRIDDKTNVYINTPDKLVKLEQVSRGTLEQIYFSLRMASAKLFFGDENMPVILDDTFAMYDERRLKNTLKWLVKSQTQVIIFTCHKREEVLLKELQIPFHIMNG